MVVVMYEGVSKDGTPVFLADKEKMADYGVEPTGKIKYMPYERVYGDGMSADSRSFFARRRAIRREQARNYF